MQELTARQQQVLDVIRHNIRATGYPPTRADIARELGFKSANAAEEHLKALARKGAIEIIPGTSRGIRLPAPMPDGLPIIGHVAAGSPILAEEHVEDYCSVPAQLFQPAADYFLRVHGESMRDVGILDGDLLAVQRTSEVRNGEIVVARIDAEVTVKRLQHTRSRHMINLLPENPDYDIIEVDLRSSDFAIEGRSVGLLRR